MIFQLIMTVLIYYISNIDTLGIHKYLMKKTRIICIMFGFTKHVFITLLLLNTTCISLNLNNQPCMKRPIFIDLNPDECNQVLCYCPFIVNLDRCNGSCNALDDLCSKQNKICKLKRN